MIVIRLALVALRRDRLRTGLSLLSLALAVSSVITVVALGDGAHAMVEQQVMSAGTNLIVVSAGNRTSSGVRLGMGSSSRLTEADAEAIRREVRGVAYVSPGVRSRQQLITGGSNWSASVEGVGADLPLLRQWPLAAGSFFSRDQVRRVAKVCVIGAVVRDLLFGLDANAVGQPVRIGTQIFRVTGVLTRKGESAGGQDQDDTVFVPYTTAQKRLMGVTYLRNIMVASVEPDATAAVAEDIRRLLRYWHEIGSYMPDDFRVRTLDDIVALRTRTTRTMTALLSGVAAVSLVVGGVGVMNIMLVSVTERTREIGLRLAVGARQRDVRRQFLMEAAVLTGIGGALGIAIGSLLAKTLTGLFDWPTDLDAATAMVALIFAGMTGVFFGWYPAHRAAATDPIDALRSE